MAVQDGLQQLGCSLGVDAHVAGDLVHGLPDADRRGEMVDDVDALKRVTQDVGIAHVAGEELHLVGEVGRTLSTRMHLGIQFVEHAHLVPCAQQTVCKV